MRQPASIDAQPKNENKKIFQKNQEINYPEIASTNDIFSREANKRKTNKQKVKFCPKARGKPTM